MGGTNLEGAAFSISRLEESEAECKQFPETPKPDRSPRKVTINHIRYLAIETDGVAAGSSAESHTYRTFLQNYCYELSTRISVINPGGADPGVYKPFDAGKVQKKLDEALGSFVFRP